MSTQRSEILVYLLESVKLFGQQPIDDAIKEYKKLARRGFNEPTKRKKAPKPAKTNDTCPRCGEAILQGQSTHIDHGRPLARGGKDSSENTRLLHAKCNLKKGSADPMKEAKRTGRLLTELYTNG